MNEERRKSFTEQILKDNKKNGNPKLGKCEMVKCGAEECGECV